MNNTRRKELKKIVSSIYEIKESLELLSEEEEEYKDNIPENLQDSERYEKAEAACENLFEAIDLLESAAESIELAKE